MIERILDKETKEYRTFRIGEKVLNRPDCNSMYRGRYGEITYLEDKYGHLSVSVRYSPSEKETHPSWVIIQFEDDSFPEELFTL